MTTQAQLGWRSSGGGGGSSAPSTATYIVKDPADLAALPNAQALGSLASGILQNTTGTGALTISTEFVLNPGVSTVVGFGANTTTWTTGSISHSAPLHAFLGRVRLVRTANVASASTVTLPSTAATAGNVSPISGTATINYITTTSWFAGSQIILEFLSTATVTNNAGSPPGSTAPILLNGGADRVMAANQLLYLYYNGTNWIEHPSNYIIASGRTGGQTINGGTGASENLDATSTSNGAKGLIRFGGATGMVWDETAKLLGLGKAPAAGRVIDAVLSGIAFEVSTTSGGQVVLTTNSVGSIRSVTTGSVTWGELVSSANGSRTVTIRSYAASAAGTTFGLSNGNLNTVQVVGPVCIGTTSASDMVFGTNNTERFRVTGSGGDFQLGATMLAANGTVATVLTSLGPTGSSTTVQEWMRVKGTAGADRWIPMF